MYTLQLLRCCMPDSFDPLDPPPSMVNDVNRCFCFASDAPGKIDHHIVLPFLCVIVFALMIAGFARLIDIQHEKK